jgi:hypothetical protein
MPEDRSVPCARNGALGNKLEPLFDTVGCMDTETGKIGATNTNVIVLDEMQRFG